MTYPSDDAWKLQVMRCADAFMSFAPLYENTSVRMLTPRELVVVQKLIALGYLRQPKAGRRHLTE